MIVARGLTKRFDDALAVDDLSFELEPGRVWALLGPGGAGKSTTLRMLVGLVQPDAGRSEILGRPFPELDDPARRVGVLLEPVAHPGRTVRDQLRVAAALAGCDAERVEQLLLEAGLQKHAGARAGTLSRDMRQRLAIAWALMADPEVLILDEPASGLGPEGVNWLAELLRDLAGEGRTVLLSSGAVADAAQTADRIVAIARGALVAESSVEELVERTGSDVVVRSPGAEVLAERLQRSGIATVNVSSEGLRARDVPASAVTELAVASGLPVEEVRSEARTLDDAFAQLTADSAAGAQDVPAAPDGARPRSGPADDVSDAERAIEDELRGQPKPSEPRIVAVASAAPEMGSTTVSFLVGDVLAEGLGLRALVVALSVDRERLTLPASPDDRSQLGLDDLLEDLDGFDEAARISPYVSVAPSGLHTLTGPRDAETLARVAPQRLNELLGFAVRFYDLIVLDVGGLEGAALRSVLTRADEVVLLASAEAGAELGEPSPVTDAIEATRGERATLVINRVDPAVAREATGSRTRGAHTVLPEDRELIRALDSGDFRLAGARPETRQAVKRLGLLVARRLS